jgi:hypothetical protein
MWGGYNPLGGGGINSSFGGFSQDQLINQMYGSGSSGSGGQTQNQSGQNLAQGPSMFSPNLGYNVSQGFSNAPQQNAVSNTAAPPVYNYSFSGPPSYSTPTPQVPTPSSPQKTQTFTQNPYYGMAGALAGYVNSLNTPNLFSNNTLSGTWGYSTPSMPTSTMGGGSMGGGSMGGGSMGGGSMGGGGGAYGGGGNPGGSGQSPVDPNASWNNMMANSGNYNSYGTPI